MKKRMLMWVSLISLSVLLSGCDVLWFSGGAGAGYYVGKDYDIKKKSD